MKIRFFNSLSHRTEEFQPLTPGLVRMYGCGPTVYDYAHIGNFRTFLFSDLIRRFLELAGYEVRHVMNITDVGHMTDDANADGAGQDRMQAAAARLREDKKSGKVPPGAIENPNDPYQIAKFYTDEFLKDARALGYKVAFEYPQRMPKATDHVPGMIEMIKQLIARGHAYVASDGVVYFDVQSFPKYGALSGNTLEHLQTGAGGRVSDENQARKRHPADFMLWKPDPSHIMKWESPWGAGYPGWHIECSVMATRLLESPVIDIHTGGEDLIFPHHECEIAQTCGATGEDFFARFWIHARFLMVEGEKMSKRKGTFFTVPDVLNGKVAGRPVDAAVLRLELIKSHYRSNLNFTAKGLSDSAVIVRRLTEFRQKLEGRTGGAAATVDLSHPVLGEFASALADDLNIAGALGVVIPWASGDHADPQEALGVWQKINSVLAIAPVHQGLEYRPAIATAVDSALQEAMHWCKDLDAARANKQFDKADEIRKRIIEAGFEVRTTKDGTSIQRPLA
jgi:cysteinyl-tRNA synthetase